MCFSVANFESYRFVLSLTSNRKTISKRSYNEPFIQSRSHTFLTTTSHRNLMLSKLPPAILFNFSLATTVHISFSPYHRFFSSACRRTCHGTCYLQLKLESFSMSRKQDLWLIFFFRKDMNHSIDTPLLLKLYSSMTKL